MCSPCFKKRGLEEGRLVDGAKIVGGFQHPIRAPAPLPTAPVVPTFAATLPAAAPAPAIPPLAIMGIGSWPRPRWLERLLHERPNSPSSMSPPTAFATRRRSAGSVAHARWR